MWKVIDCKMQHADVFSEKMLLVSIIIGAVDVQEKIHIVVISILLASSSDSEIYSVITNRKANNLTALTDSDSNLFARPDGTTCYTYYKKDGNGNSFNKSFQPNGIWNVCYDSYQSYNCFRSNLRISMGYFDVEGHKKECCENNNYNPLPVTAGVQKLMINASKSSPPCDTSSSKIVTGSNYYSSNSHTSFCKYLETVLYINPDSIKGVSFSAYDEGDDIAKLFVPVFGSGACNFKSGDATKLSAPNNNSKIATISGVPHYIYCPDGSEPIQNGNDFSCIKYNKIETTTYAYNWTVNYYKKK